MVSRSAALARPLHPILADLHFHRQLGAGGAGTVWLASAKSSGKFVAVKTLRADLGEDEVGVESFFDEARALAALDHPGIVQVHDAGIASSADARASGGRLRPGAPYLIMDFVEHGSLADVERRLSDAAILRVCADLLAALAHAHARGLLHRDIKPANILLRTNPSALQDFELASSVALADFGIAVSLEQLRGDETHVTGTFSFMAPEHLMGRSRDYGPATDLFAVGCLAWVLVYGQVPHQEGATSARDLMDRRLRGLVPTPPKGVRPHPLFHPWLLHLTRANPWERLAHAADARASLLSQASVINEGQSRRPRIDPASIHAGDTEVQLDALPITENPVSAVTRTQRMGAAFLGEDAVTAPEPPATIRGAHVAALDAPSKGHEVATSALEFGAPALGNLASAIAHLRRGIGRGDREVEPPKGLFGATLLPVKEPPMVGRAALRGALVDDFVRVIQERRPQLHVLFGTAGVGKTSVGRWLHREVSERGLAHSWWAQHGSQAESGAGLPSMVRRFYGCVGRSASEVRHRAQHVHMSLSAASMDAKLATSLMLADQPDDGVVSRLHFQSARDRYVALGRLFDSAASDRPLLLVIDDAQWGVDMCMATSHLLNLRLPLLVVMTWRGTPESFDRRMRYLSSRHDVPLHTMTEHATRHIVGPLSHAEQRKVIAATLALEEPLVERVLSASQGTPLLAVQLVRELLDAGKLVSHEREFVNANRRFTEPLHVSTLWPRRLATMAARSGLDVEETTRVLQMAAILGKNVVVRELQAACKHLALEWPVQLLGALETHGLGAVDTRAGTFQFAHGLLQEHLIQKAVEDNAVKGLHLAAFRALSEGSVMDDGDLERLGVHCLRAEMWTDAAEAWCTLGRRLLDRAELREAKRICELVGTLLSEPRASMPTAQRAWALEMMTRVHFRFGLLSDARETLREAVNLLDANSSTRLRAHLAAAEGMVETIAGNGGSALEAFQAALAYSSAEIEAGDRAKWMYGQANTLKQLGELDASDQCYARSEELFRRAADVTGELRVALNWAELLIRLGRESEAETLIQRCLEATEVDQHRQLKAMLLLNRGALLRAHGKDDEAVAVYREAFDLFDALESTDVMAPASNLVGIYLAHGEREQAEQMMRIFAGAVHRGSREGIMSYVHAQQAGVDALFGRWEAVDTHADAMLRVPKDKWLIDEDIGGGWYAAWKAARDGAQRAVSDKLFRLACHQFEKLPRLPRFEPMRQELGQNDLCT